VLEVLTMHLGPDELLVALKVDLRDDISGRDVEKASTAIEKELRRRHPMIRHVFVDATSPTEEQDELAAALRALAAEEAQRGSGNT